MLFSVITICRNEEKRISKTLDTICKQNFYDFEYIIQDGQSSDNTLLIVQEYKKKYPHINIRVISERDCGLYDAMNKAVSYASGQYICFINSGDFLFDENTLKQVARAISLSPDMDWYYGECIVIYPNGDELIQIPTTIENISGDEMRDYLKKRQLQLIHQSIFSKRELLKRNPFDVTYKIRAELKWYYECLLTGIKIKKMDFPVCMYSQGGISERASSVPINAQETRRIFEEKNLLTEDNVRVLPGENDYTNCFKEIYSQWLALKQSGHQMEQYLQGQGVKSIAIYGYAEFGTHVINELKNSSIIISCIIDKQNKHPYSGIPVISPENFRENVDLIIVTALSHYREIYENMSGRTECKICSLEDILEDMWIVDEKNRNLCHL